MKKTIALIMVLLLSVLTVACEKRIENKETTTDRASTEIQHKSTTLMSEEKITGGGFLTTRKYRVRYYSVPYQFVLIVGRDAYEEWDNEYNADNPDDTNEMVIKKFVQHFDISREDFEKANLEFAKVLGEGVINFPLMNPKDYAGQEVDEIFNPDIIYTFDDEIINNYYLSPEYPFGMWIEYNDALEAGAYETRTTDWVDIEQMEADIIAKYGEAEIVTEAVTAESTVESSETETPSETLKDTDE